MLMYPSTYPATSRQATRTALAGLLLASSLLAGCSSTPEISPHPGPIEGTPTADLDARTGDVSADPVAYLHRTPCTHVPENPDSVVPPGLWRRGMPGVTQDFILGYCPPSLRDCAT